MCEPVRILDLAEQMFRLSERGRREQISIVYTGLRPGEKLHEVLFHPDEKYQRTVHPRIFQAEQRPVSVQQVAAWLEEARAMVEQHDEAGLENARRSEEHTSELQSLLRTSYTVFCLKKKHSQQTEAQATKKYKFAADDSYRH